MRKLKKAVFVSLYCFIVVTALPELILHIMGHYGENDKTAVIKYDSTLGWTYMPNVSFTDTGFDWCVKYYINQDGLRERKNIGPKDPDVYRILLLGDSFVEGFAVGQEERFSALLGPMFRDKKLKVQVISGGMRGYNMAQYYLQLQRLYAKYAPDMVIICPIFADLDVVTNDRLLVDGDTVYFRPYFEAESGKLILKGVPVKRLDMRAEKPDKFGRLKKYLRNSALYTMLRIVSDRSPFFKKIAVSLRIKKDTSKISDYRHILEFTSRARDPMLFAKDRNDEVNRLILKAISERLAHDGVKFMVYLLTDDEYGTNDRFYAKTAEDVGFIYANFAKISDRYKNDKNKSRYFFKFNEHFTRQGNMLVARALCDYLEPMVPGIKR